MNKTIQARLFLVGAPRSGTTLLQSLLAAHSTITSFPESHVLLVSSRSRRGRWMRKLGLVAPEMRQRLREFLNEVGHPEWMPPVSFRLRPFIQQFAQLLDQLTEAQGKSIWLEKTPGHLYYIQDFARAIPSTRFIHLVRNGADVVASLYEVTNQYPEQWGGRYTIEHAVHTWNRSIALSADHCTKPNHLWVSYEQLVAEPALTLASICTFIGIAPEAAMINQYSQQTHKLILAHEEWKQGTKQAINRNRSTKFQQLFTPPQQAQILAMLRNGGIPR